MRRVFRFAEYGRRLRNEVRVVIVERCRADRDRAVDRRVSVRRTPVAQTVGNDVVLGQRRDVIDPLFHFAVVDFERFLVAEIEVDIPRDLDDGGAPVRRCHAAQAASRGDHERNARLLVCKIKFAVVQFLMQRVFEEYRRRRADVAHVFHPEVIHAVIHTFERRYRMGVAEPAAAFAVRAVGRQAVNVAQHRPDGQFVQAIDLRVGTFERTDPFDVGVYDHRFQPVFFGLGRRAR